MEIAKILVIIFVIIAIITFIFGAIMNIFLRSSLPVKR